MPEGHTLHRLAHDLTDAFAGRPVRVSSPQGRFDAEARQLDGQVFEGAQAWGKQLFLEFAGERYVHIHLGLIGKLQLTPYDGDVPPPVGQVRLRLVGVDAVADLRGATACDLIGPAEKAVVHARLGADPLRRDAHPEQSWQRISTSRAPIGTLLMDQTVIAGVGNVFRAEVLYRHTLSPFRPGHDVTREEWEAIWADLSALLRAGVRRKRIVTTRVEDRPRRTRRPTVEESFYVYRRAGEPCRVCGTEVRTETMQGRNLFWCPTCQAT
jgi:endonuclease VIII